MLSITIKPGTEQTEIHTSKDPLQLEKVLIRSLQLGPIVPIKLIWNKAMTILELLLLLNPTHPNKFESKMNLKLSKSIPKINLKGPLLQSIRTTNNCQHFQT